MIHAFANQRSGQAAVTSQALAHRSFFDGFTFAKRNSGVSPAEGAIGNPAAFAIGRGHPNLNPLAVGFDFETPLGFEISNFAVGNHNSLQWIDDYEFALAKNQLWSNPEQVGRKGYERSDSKIKKLTSGVYGVENRLSQENGVKAESYNRPDQVALRAKDFIHASIIAGNSAVGKGK